jgi:hypothetical protein
MRARRNISRLLAMPTPLGGLSVLIMQIAPVASGKPCSWKLRLCRSAVGASFSVFAPSVL